jgi:hypothetical protein
MNRVEPLAPVDAAFVAVETPAAPMHVLAVAVLGRPPDPPGDTTAPSQDAAAPTAGPEHRAGVVPAAPLTLAVLRQLVVDRLGHERRLWQRLVRVPCGLDHPLWVDDPAVDLEHHVRKVALPAPGGPAELHELVALEASRPLDPDRPLWELLLVEGLDQDYRALVGKVHHALFDGVSGLAVLAGLFDQAGSDLRAAAGAGAGQRRRVGDAAAGRCAPGAAAAPAGGVDGLRMLTEVAQRWARRPLALGDAVAGTYLAWRQRHGAGDPASTVAPGGVGQLGDPARPPDDGPDGSGGAGQPPAPAPGTGRGPTLPFRSPRAPWNGAVSRGRRSSHVQLPLGDLRQVTAALGGTVNDVLLAAVASALRRCAAEDPARPGLEAGRPLTAGIPVSRRRPTTDRGETGGRAAPGNQVLAAVVSLATDVEDPVERYRLITVATERAKRFVAELPDEAVCGWAELAVPAVAGRLVRLAANLRLFDRMPPPVNVVVSNLVGPTAALELQRRPVVELQPFGPVVDGVGLNLTAVSYGGVLTVGLQACRERLEDLDRLALDVVDGATALVKAAAASADLERGGLLH